MSHSVFPHGIEQGAADRFLTADVGEAPRPVAPVKSLVGLAFAGGWEVFIHGRTAYAVTGARQAIRAVVARVFARVGARGLA